MVNYRHLWLYAKGFYKMSDLFEDLKVIVAKTLDKNIQIVDNSLVYNTLIFCITGVFNNEDFKIVLRDVFQSLCTINSEQLIRIIINQMSNKNISNLGKPDAMILPLSNILIMESFIEKEEEHV